MRPLVFATIVLFPASYALKYVYGVEVTWIDPAYLVGLLALGLHFVARRGRLRLPRDERAIAAAAALFVVSYTVAGLASLVRYSASQGAVAPTAYSVLREPIRLCLSAGLFFLVLFVVESRRRYEAVLKVLVWTGIAEFLLAVYMLIAFAVSLYLPPGWADYMKVYYWRQALYQGGLVVPRLGGTFFEAPIYGLFMLTTLGANLLLLRLSKQRLYKVTLAVVALGTLACLSDQVLLGMVALGVVVCLTSLAGHGWHRPLALILGLTAVLGLVAWLGVSVARKSAVEARLFQTRGLSVGERLYHVGRALDHFETNPFIGIGPGLYGHYAAKTGSWPRTVTVQVMLPEILVDSGILGLGAFLIFAGTSAWWLARKPDKTCLGIALSLLIADSLQANWKWGFVSFALGLTIVHHRFAAPRAAAAQESG